MNHIFGCPMHYGVGAPGLINSLDYLQYDWFEDNDRKYLK